MTKTKHVAASAAIVVGSFFVVHTAFAHDNHSAVKDETANKPVAMLTEKQRADEVRQKLEERKQELQKQVQEKRAEVKEKLSDNRKKVCDKRQVNINKIIANSNLEGQRNLQTFANIQARVMQFATDKNLNIDNYDALVTDADTKKAAAQAALDVATQTIFSCDDTDPSSPGKVVSDLMHTKHDALKEYRTSVKNLIVAVKQAAGDKTKTTESEQ